MNVRNGEVLALGSAPSFDPNIFAKLIRPADYERLSSEEAGKPLVNRATQGGYPTGSTFKLITAVAALEGGLITPDTVQYDGGSLQVGGVTFKNAGGVVNGALALRQALSVSSDVFFYRLGLEANSAGNGLLIQDWAKRLGLGRPTGIDLPSEAEGLVPTPKYRNDGYAEYRKCVAENKPTPEEISLGECGFIDRPWSQGDNINLSVGQGDLQANPLQMAVAYAAIANGGKVVQPRLGQRIEYPGGRVLQELDAPGRAQAEHQRRQPPGHPRRPALRRERVGRHLGRRLRGLRDPDRRQDRHRGEGRRAAPTSPGTWRWRPTRAPSTRWSPPSRRAASAPRRPRPAARSILAELFGVNAGSTPAGDSQD